MRYNGTQKHTALSARSLFTGSRAWLAAAWHLFRLWATSQHSSPGQMSFDERVHWQAPAQQGFV